jgi:hypothetical protein
MQYMPWFLRPKLSLIGLSLGQPENSAVVERIMDTGHDIKFNNIYRLDKATGDRNMVASQSIQKGGGHHVKLTMTAHY